MKNIFLSVLLLLIVSVCKAQYNPANFTVSNKAYGVAQAVPTDARSFYYDGSLFVMRPYQSTAEVLSYLNLAKYRIGNFPIYVNVGGTLQSGGTFTGGTITEYWFRDGTADGNLVAKLVPETDPKRVTGVAITGTTTKTVTITLADASTVTGTFTDLSGASTPTLQQVSDVGHTTTTDITANNFRGASVILNSNGGGGVSAFTNTDGDLNINYGKDGGNVVLAKGTTGTFRDTITKSGTIAMISDVDLKVDKATGKQLSTEDYSTAEKTKLAGIATGATANSSDATLLNRANHTGTQTASTISDFQSSARSAISLTTTGSSGAATYNSSTGVLNVPSYSGGGASAWGSIAGTLSSQTDLQTALDAKQPLVSASKGAIIGNSTVASYLLQNGIATYLLTACDTLAGATVDTLAVPGHTINQQLAMWQASANKSLYDWVIVEIGLNDLDYTESAATALIRYQKLIDTIYANKKASAKIIVSTMTPDKTRLTDVYGGTNGLTAYQKWLDMNTAIMGTGTNKILRVDYRVNKHTDILNDGTGNMSPLYDMGDHVHENNAARYIIAQVWRRALNELGFLKCGYPTIPPVFTTTTIIPAIAGSTASNGSITIDGTTTTPKTTSYVTLQSTGGLVGIGTTAPTDYLTVSASVAAANGVRGIMKNTSSQGDAQWAVTNSVGGVGFLGKWGTGQTTYKTIAANSGDLVLYNGPTNGNITILSDRSAGNITLTAGGASSAHLTVNSSGLISFPTTVTAAGTTGNQTINKTTGTVNIAAAATSVTVTDVLVTANSLVQAWVRTNDANKTKVTSVVPAAGSFTINVDTAPAAEISIGFIVFN